MARSGADWSVVDEELNLGEVAAYPRLTPPTVRRLLSAMTSSATGMSV